MSLYVMICSKLESHRNNELHKLNVNHFKIDVKTLSETVSKQYNINEDLFDLMCFGRVLTSDKTLEWYGIKNGTTIFMLNKINYDYLVDNQTKDKSNKEKANKEKASQSDIQHMVIALRTALMNSSFRSILDKLSESEARENLMAVTPGLREDPITFAILQDPELLTTLTDPTNIYKVLERHPCLLEAATHLSASFHEENSNSQSSASLLGRGSLSYNYSLDLMSDDEYMSETESPAEPQQQQQQPNAREVANLLVQAFRSNPRSASQSTSQGVITQDMLRQALQSSQAPHLSQPSTSSSTSSVAARLRNWSTQLQQMRDLGINDEIVAIQALEATNGDVQAALNLIFSDNNP